MFNSLIRTTRRTTSLMRPYARRFSTAAEQEDEASVKIWVHVTTGFVAIVSGLYGYHLFLASDDNGVEKREMSYTSIKHKPFPWKGAPHKNLFDLSPDE
mmetsp:Transcript_35343/g.60531  ORF Transcript_35343/g.60531 Transcript_35343/m.60531 type:complete len:99 (-) Transcript_35343:88-384(-)